MKTDKLYNSILLFLSLTLVVPAFGQSDVLAMAGARDYNDNLSSTRDVSYFNEALEPVSADYDHISFIAVKDVSDPQHVRIEVYSSKSGEKIMTGSASGITDDFNGYFEHYYQNGQLESCGEYQNGIKIGEWQRFTQNGKQKASRFYSEERLEMLLELSDK